MSKTEIQIVPGTSGKLTTRSATLVRRGLDDLVLLQGNKRRVLVISDEEAIGEALVPICSQDGFEAAECNPFKNGECVLNEALEEAVAFQPDATLLYTNVLIATNHIGFIGFVLSLFARLPDCDFVFMLFPDDWKKGLYDDVIAEIQAQRHNFGVLWMPFEKHELLNAIRRRRLDDLPTGFSGNPAADAWIERGINFEASGRHEEAISCFESAIEIFPRCIRAWRYRGVSLDSLGRFAESIESLNKGLEIDPLSYGALVDKGSVLEKLRRFEDAIHCYDSANQISPNNVAGWTGKGHALHQLGRYDEAVRCFEKVFEVDHPTWTDWGRAHCFSDAWNSKGTSLFRLGRYQESIECYERAIALDPDFPFPWYNKGNSLREMNNLDEAIRCYDRAIELDPEHAGSWNNKGICLKQMGRLDDARVCQEKFAALTSKVSGVLT